MRTNAMQPIGLGEVIDLSRVPKSPTKNLHDPVFITDKKLVPSTSDVDVYRKTDVDASLISGDPYTEIAQLIEDMSIGSVDVCSPFVASIGAGASKIQVHSIFANSEQNAPTIHASQTGIKKVFLNKENKLTYEDNIAWTVVSNGSKFFAYPINTTQTQTMTCRMSTDGITWSVETMTGQYPVKFTTPSTHRWFYNTTSTGVGIIPAAIPTPDIYSIGTNFFLLSSNRIHKTANGVDWEDITLQVFGSAEVASKGHFFGINGNSAFIVTSYGIRYTEDQGQSFSIVNAFEDPTSYGFVENKTNKAKYIANSTTPDNRFFVTTNTGKTWSLSNTSINANCVMYMNQTIVLLEKNSAVCKTSSDDGTTFSDTAFPADFVYPIRTGVCTKNAFYVKDSDSKIYRSVDGISWALCCTYMVSDEVINCGVSPNSTTDILFSNNPTGKFPYIIIWNSGSNSACAKIGESVGSVLCPAIGADTSVFGANSFNKFGVMTTLSNLQSPPYTKLSTIKIPQNRVGTYPYIRIG